MRILMFINSMQPSGGIERVVATLSSQLAKKHEIVILVKDEPISFYELDERVKIESLNRPLVFDMSNRIARIKKVIANIVSIPNILKSYISSGRFEYVYVVHPLNVLEYKLSGLDPKLLIISEHGAKSAYNVFYKIVKKFLYSNCKAYVVPTKADSDDYIDQGFPAYHVPHFLSRLSYKECDRTENIVLNIGRMTPDKQQSDLIDIWHTVIFKYKVKNWKLRIVGSGELKSFLSAKINRLMLDQYIEVCNPIEDVGNYYLSASAFALTSRSEGFGMVLLEAISFGIPVVSFDCPSGPKEIIDDGETGYLVPLGEKDLFSEKLVSLINTSGEVNRMGHNAFQSSQKWNDKKILKIWDNILAS